MIVANWCMFRLLKYLPKFIIIPCAEINTQWFQCSVRPCNPNRCVTFGNKIALFNILFYFYCVWFEPHFGKLRQLTFNEDETKKKLDNFSFFVFFWLSTIISKKGKRIRLLFGWSTRSREIFTCDRKHLVSLFPPNMKKKEFNAFFYLLLYTNDGTDDKQNQCEFYLFFSGWKETIWIGSWAVWMTTSIEIVSR